MTNILMDESSCPLVARSLTMPGAVMGTAAYMSPEQARGEALDERSDLFSLGIVLYESLTGVQPFQGETLNELMRAIEFDPPPLPVEWPAPMQQLLHRALQKNPAHRYPSAAAFMEELQACAMLFERVDQATSFGGTKLFTRRIALTILALLIFCAASAWLFAKRNQRHSANALSDKDILLLADWVNQTGDGVFDGALKQGLAVQLQQSQYLSLFPDLRVQQTLRLMGKAPDTRVTRDIGREIAVRQGLKAVLTGTITKYERRYSLTLEALNSQTGGIIALTQIEAEGIDQILSALTKAAASMRERLGESLRSIQNFDAPLEVTTSSLEALKAYSVGQSLTTQGNLQDAVPFYERAIEIDPNFAQAYLTLAIAAATQNHTERAASLAQRAFDLRDKVSELERLNATAFYYAFVTGEMDQVFAAQTQLKHAYPRMHVAPGNLGVSYGQIGQYERAVTEIRQAMQLNPNTAAWYVNLANNLIALNQFEEARQVCRQALAQKFDSANIRSLLFSLDFVSGNQETQVEHIAWARQHSEEPSALEWQASAAAYMGQWADSKAFAQKAIEMAEKKHSPELAAQFAAEQALRAAAFAQRTGAKQFARQALSIARNRNTVYRTALALAYSGYIANASELADELNQRYPKRTLIQELWLPLIHATIALRKGNLTLALRELERAQPYATASEFWFQYLRAQIYLKQQDLPAAVSAFDEITLHRGWAPLSVLYPLAQTNADSIKLSLQETRK